MAWHPWLLVRLDQRGDSVGFTAGLPARIEDWNLADDSVALGVPMIHWKASKTSGRIWVFFSHRQVLKSRCLVRTLRNPRQAQAQARMIPSLSTPADISPCLIFPMCKCSDCPGSLSVPSSVTAACSTFRKWHKHFPFCQWGGVIARSFSHLFSQS